MKKNKSIYPPMNYISARINNSLRSASHWVGKSTLLICLAMVFCYPQVIVGAQEAIPVQTVQAVPPVPVVNKNLADLQPKLTELRKKLLDMQAEMSTVDDTQSIIDRLLSLSEKKNTFEEQFHQLKIDPHSNVQQLNELQNKLQSIEQDIVNAVDTLDSSIAILDNWLDFWAAEKNKLDDWQKGLGSSSSLQTVEKTLNKLATTVVKANTDINDHLLPLLALQEKAGSMQVAAYNLHIQIGLLFKDKYQPELHKHAAPLFSSEFTKDFTIKLWQDTKHGFLLALKPDTQFIIQQKALLTATAVFFLILLVVFSTGRSYLSSSSRWNFVSRRPISVALFLSFFLTVALTDKLPPFWLAVFRDLSLLCVIRIGRVIVSNKLHKNAITRLALLLLITNLLVMITLPMPLMRLYILAVALVFLPLFLIQRTQLIKSSTTSPLAIWIRRFAILCLLIILFAEISGQAELAFFIFSACLKTFYSGLFLWVFYLILMAMVELCLHYTPLSLIKNNIRQVATMIRPVLLVGCLLTFLVRSLVDWRLFTTTKEGLRYLIDLTLSYGEIHISFGLVLVAVLLLYCSYCLSRTLQAILLQSVLPRQHMDEGVQLSITRLLHYAIMLIGFLLAMGAMGFSLTNLTILGGALGVGIGFGLQEIIKNFACGLILLFERPIKLGDTIQIGEDMAVVKELGLRATVVQTFDNAEIVLPNSDLITGPVTNWTLKERRVRIKVPIGVAYGSNIEKVVEILLSCAEAHPLVLSTPKASALFLAFGTSSLDFELRVFIPEFTDRRLVLSELNQAINSEFTDAGIEIPFPQNDLHLRSIDKDLTHLFTA